MKEVGEEIEEAIEEDAAEEESGDEVAELTPDNPGPATLAAEENLWSWNFWMVISHLSQALMIVTLALTKDSVKNFKLPLVTHFLSWSRLGPRQATQ